ncbi:hypothetical protein BH11PSE8_BH11PSE8_06860 [soil metagenome]
MLCNDDIARHARLHKSVEVHASDADSVTPPDACADVAHCAGTTLHLIPCAGHTSLVEAPIAVARLISGATNLSLGDQPT